MTDPLYREIILEHWTDPQNYGVLPKADLDITRANPLCGDKIRITATIAGGYISAIRFTSTGCAISTACASILTSLVTHMPIRQFLALSPETFLKRFEIGLSPVRVKCALLAFSTLKSALKQLPTHPKRSRPHRATTSAR